MVHKLDLLLSTVVTNPSNKLNVWCNHLKNPGQKHLDYLQGVIMPKFHIDTHKEQQKQLKQISQQHLKPLKPKPKPNEEHVKLIKGYNIPMPCNGEQCQ
jgi:hypothetical protein